jgi:hypothetical protein
MKPMTVGELIEQLKSFPKDKEVLFTYNYGDHWRTEVAQEIRSVEVGYVRHSDYHHMDKVLDQDVDPEDETKIHPSDDEDAREVVLLMRR